MVFAEAEAHNATIRHKAAVAEQVLESAPPWHVTKVEGVGRIAGPGGGMQQHPPFTFSKVWGCGRILSSHSATPKQAKPRPRPQTQRPFQGNVVAGRGRMWDGLKRWWRS